MNRTALAILALLTASSVESPRAQVPAPLMAVARYSASGDTAIVVGTGAASWRQVTVGSDPALSPDGRLLAFTYYQRLKPGESGFVSGISVSERYVRVLDIASGTLTPPRRFDGLGNQYGAQWSLDGSLVFFKVFNGDDWDIGQLSYPGLQFRKISAYPAEAAWSRMSGDSGLALEIDAVDTDPPVLKDEAAALFLLDRTRGTRTRVTPIGFSVSRTACWVGATQDVLLAGHWTEPGHVSSEPSSVFRLNPSEREWSKESRRVWATKRIGDGFQVSCARR